MIKCNLAVILAERGLKISDVAKETGISRTTLTALSHNYGKGIQFDTLNELCEYFNLPVSALLTHHFLHIAIEKYAWVDENVIELICNVQFDDVISYSTIHITIVDVVETPADFGDVGEGTETKIKISMNALHSDSALLKIPDAKLEDFIVENIDEILEERYHHVTQLHLVETKQRIRQ